MIYRILYQIRNWRAHWRALYLGTKTFTVRLPLPFNRELFYKRWLKAKAAIFFQGTLGAVVLKCRCGDSSAHLGRSCPKARMIPLGVISKRVVTNAGVEFMVDDFDLGGATTDITNFNFHDSGTGTAPESVTDIDLAVPAGPTTRATGTKSQPAPNQYRTVGTINYNATLSITEHGLFNQAARGAGSVLWDRSVFAAINVVSGDSIQFTYTLTVNAGG